MPGAPRPQRTSGTCQGCFDGFGPAWTLPSWGSLVVNICTEVCAKTHLSPDPKVRRSGSRTRLAAGPFGNWASEFGVKLRLAYGADASLPVLAAEQDTTLPTFSGTPLTQIAALLTAVTYT